ncbi:MAG: hypothetical protein GX166_08975 [Clostridiaceae bacterium]|nr:hypothetical protein [Clostridiaceae bacterium]
MKARRGICSIVILMALIIGLLVMPSSSSVDYLPELDFINPYETRENASALIVEKVNNIRALHGLAPLGESNILVKSAKYKSLYISQYPENINETEFVSGPLKDKSLNDILPYVEKEEILYMLSGGNTSDESLATYFSRTLETSFSSGRILLNPGIKSIGVSIVQFQTMTGAYTVCVLHASSEESLQDEINVVPDNIVKNDTTPPEVEVMDTYIAKDYVLSEEKILRNIKYMDNSKGACTITFDMDETNISKIGEYNLTIVVSDASGNKTEKIMKVHVVPHVNPIISGDEIIIPIVSFDDVYDISKYVVVRDNYGIEYIHTEPKLAVRQDDGQEVKVSVMNKAGLSIEKTMVLKFSDVEHFSSPVARVYPIYPAKGEPISIEMIKSAIVCRDEEASIEVDTDSFNAIDLEVPGIYYCLANIKLFVDDAYVQTPVAVPVHVMLDDVFLSDKSTKQQYDSNIEISYSKLNRSALVQEGAHIVLEANADYEGEILYSYKFSRYGETNYIISRKDNSLVWYPENTGLYEISVVAHDAEMDVVIGAATMNLYVSEMTLENIQNPYLDLKPSSEYVVDSISKTISNLVPKTTVDAFLENFVIEDEGVLGLKIRVADINNNIITGDSYVGTGAVIELYKEDVVYERYTVILYGDVDGDGLIRTSDLLNVRYYMLRRIELEGVRFIAANADNSDDRNVVNSLDLLRIRYYLLGRVDIEQNRK